jgi:hypothetical protein
VSFADVAAELEPVDWLVMAAAAVCVVVLVADYRAARRAAPED